MYAWHCRKKRFKLKASSTFGGYSKSQRCCILWETKLRTLLAAPVQFWMLLKRSRGGGAVGAQGLPACFQSVLVVANDDYAADCTEGWGKEGFVCVWQVCIPVYISALANWRWDLQWELFLCQAVWLPCFRLNWGLYLILAVVFWSTHLHTSGWFFVLFFLGGEGGSFVFLMTEFCFALESCSTCLIRKFVVVKALLWFYFLFVLFLFCWDSKWTGHMQRKKTLPRCCISKVGALALLKVPGCHLLFLVLTDAVAHLPCAKISISYCDCVNSELPIQFGIPDQWRTSSGHILTAIWVVQQPKGINVFICI